mgnify:CR=1 FL=1
MGIKSAAAFLASLITGGLAGAKPSALLTDAYKWAMVQAGFPLRRETFVLSFRKGGPLYVPCDLSEVIRGFCPRMPDAKETGFLVANGYGPTPAMLQALGGDLDIWTAPKGSLVYPGEPVAVITGPSFLVSWLEPLVIMLHFPLQVAAAMLNGKRSFIACCDDEAAIIQFVADCLGIDDVKIPLDQGYAGRVARIVRGLWKELDGLDRAFEVGMRAATCMQQHRIALVECRKQGLNKTSNVKLAYDLYMIPVGTTGHEHQQRWGNDYDGYRAVRDTRPEPPSYLFDTFDPINKGIPAAIEVMSEKDVHRRCTVRFDDFPALEQHLTMFVKAEGKSETRPNYIFEDGYNLTKTRFTEDLCTKLGVAKSRTGYGYGGAIVSAASLSPYGRNAVAAVYKLSMTGTRPVMKFSGHPSKQSIPGKPCILRRSKGYSLDRQHIQWESLIAQQGETVEWFRPIQAGDRVDPNQIGYSPATQHIIWQCQMNTFGEAPESGAVPYSSLDHKED